MSVSTRYLLPLRAESPRHDLTAYLRALSELIDVTVVDGSPSPVFEAHAAAWQAVVQHVPVDPQVCYGNGKVNGVVTGLLLTNEDLVVIADDDVRYGPSELARMVEALQHAEVVIPQNYFDPLPWHARWDTARTLLNRAVGHDYPGTLGVHRGVIAQGYDGDVLFENLELIRTAKAAGARVLHVPDLFVHRLPCDAAQFRNQRLRQAYDSFAQPARLALELAVLPGAVWSWRRYGLRGPAGMAAAAIALAEIGRRRGSGTKVFAPSTSLWAPAWVTERALCSWGAVVVRLRGGVRYSGSRLRRAATPQRVLARRAAAGRAAGTQHYSGERTSPDARVETGNRS